MCGLEVEEEDGCFFVWSSFLMNEVMLLFVF